MTATYLLATLSACSFMPAEPPANAIVARTTPVAWKAVATKPGADPSIVGARFSSLDVELGQDWDGDVVTSTGVATVVLHTNLFDIAATQTAPGRFHFLEHVIDDPAFIVRPYAVDIIATDAAGRTAKLIVPFRLRGHGVAAGA